LREIVFESVAARSGRQRRLAAVQLFALATVLRAQYRERQPHTVSV
jgi:hypothetical protein